MMKKILYIICFLVFTCSGSFAGDETAASCSAAHIQTAIDACIGDGGGVVTIPACSANNTWTDDQEISVNTTVEYYIRGAGSDQTIIGYAESNSAGTMWEFRGPGLKEFSGMYLEGNADGSVSTPMSFMATSGTCNGSTTLVQDIESKYFYSRGHVMYSKVVFSNNIFHQKLDGNQYHFDVYDCANVDWGDDGITYPDNFGSDDVNVVAEGNTFYGTHHIFSGFSRAKILFRYNNVYIYPEQLSGDNQGNLDAHEVGYGYNPPGDGITDSDCWAHGSQGFEIHNNYFRRYSTEIDGGVAIRLRAGSALITKNHIEDYNNGIRLVMESRSVGNNCTVVGGTPLDTDFAKTLRTCAGASEGCCDAINNTYVWDNTFVSVANDNFALESPGGVALQEDDDYYLRAPTQEDDGFTWTAYTCPHPLAGSGSCDNTEYGTAGYTLGASSKNVSIGGSETLTIGGSQTLTVQ